VRARKLNRPAEILLVEDNFREVELVRLALESCKMNHHLHVAEDGVRALAFLRRHGKYAKAARPDLVLLDLKLPRKDGYEVLAEIKTNGRLKVIPVVVLTTSDSDEDMLRCYELHANGFITKPGKFQELVRVMRSIDGFWFDVVYLPSEGQ
jgi:two-component system response regulator